MTYEDEDECIINGIIIHYQFIGPRTVQRCDSLDYDHNWKLKNPDVWQASSRQWNGVQSTQYRLSPPPKKKKKKKKKNYNQTSSINSLWNCELIWICFRIIKL